MAPRQRRSITFTGLRGRDGHPVWAGEIPRDRALEMLNVDGYRAAFARKRGGASSLFAGTSGQVFTGILSAITRHVPGADATAAELWGIDSAATPVVQRLTGGTAWSSPTLVDNVASRPQDAAFCSFNGKLFIAYDSTVDRLHCWDPASVKVRRTGLATPATPVVQNAGVGAYAATLRYYKVSYAVLSGSTVLRQSELTAAQSFTPSGGGTSARVLKPATISEDETHWQVWASADDTIYHLLSTIVVGTTTYDDSATPSAYTGDAPPLAGTHTNWTSVKYLLGTDDHLIGMGAWETSGAKYSRVWWSGVTGQTGVGDDESVIQTTAVSNYVDLDEKDGGEGTGLGGPIDGRPLIFKRNQVWRLVPTGLDNPFYAPRPIFKGSGIGCIRHQTIVNAEDETGRPAVYWLSENGPYRLGAEGPQDLVDDIQDLWDTVNLDATTAVGHGVWHHEKHQVWWWIATGANNEPDTKIVFDVRKGMVTNGRVRGGWYRHSGDSAAARCSTMFSSTVGASMSRALKPYTGRSTGSVILKCDTTDLDDAGTTFQAYVDLPDTHLAGIDHLCAVGTPVIVGSAGSHSISATYTRDYGEEARSAASVTMTAVGSSTRTTAVIEGTDTADAHAVRLRIGDAAAIANAWTIDAVAIPFEVREVIGSL